MCYFKSNIEFIVNRQEINKKKKFYCEMIMLRVAELRLKPFPFHSTMSF